jgi:hypothetical protein
MIMSEPVQSALEVQSVFQEWRQECVVIQEEMGRLLRTECPSSDHERMQRRRRFQELMERREAAARKILPPKRMFPLAKTEHAPGFDA